mgnify:CR=1 FL=1
MTIASLFFISSEAYLSARPPCCNAAMTVGTKLSARRAEDAKLVGEARRYRLQQLEERGVAKQEAMVARLFYGKVATLMARCFRAWRGVCAPTPAAL